MGWTHLCKCGRRRKRQRTHTHTPSSGDDGGNNHNDGADGDDDEAWGVSDGSELFLDVLQRFLGIGPFRHPEERHQVRAEAEEGHPEPGLNSRVSAARLAIHALDHAEGAEESAALSGPVGSLQHSHHHQKTAEKENGARTRRRGVFGPKAGRANENKQHANHRQRRRHDVGGDVVWQASNEFLRVRGSNVNVSGQHHVLGQQWPAQKRLPACLCFCIGA